MASLEGKIGGAFTPELGVDLKASFKPKIGAHVETYATGAKS